MQISITNDQKRDLRRLKAPDSSLAATVRQAINDWIKSRNKNNQNLKKILNEVTSPDKQTMFKTKKQIDQWLKQLRQDREIDL